jgi:predicted nucleic acid-binding protein
MYLVGTDAISELRKGPRSNAGVRSFFERAGDEGMEIYLSAVTIGELRQGVERIRYRGDKAQAEKLERWLIRLTTIFADRILAFDEETAQVWDRLRVPNPENPLDKQIAATALIHDLAVVSRNVAHFAPTGAQVVNPFT